MTPVESFNAFLGAVDQESNHEKYSLRGFLVSIVLYYFQMMIVHSP